MTKPALPTAILVDGSFFLKRFKFVYPKVDSNNSKLVADTLYTMLHSHVKDEALYRILFYDCLPLTKKVHNPINGEIIDFSKSKEAQFRFEFLNELKKKRKMALRMGYISTKKQWILWPRITKSLLNKTIQIDDLTEKDVYYQMQQKGVDIKIGLDIASLAYKKLVRKIILISGDSDFVPAAKLARREGIDFILDPMWNNINESLHEHIDGLRSTCPRPAKFLTPSST